MAEFNTRSRLQKLGYQFDGSRILAWKADAFVLIATEIDKLEAEEMKQRRKR